MGKKISLCDALVSSNTAPLRAPPAWTDRDRNAKRRVRAAAGSGRLGGTWHRQTSDEFLLVLEGPLTVEFDAGPLSAAPGEAILIAAADRHRATVPDHCLRVSVEGVGLKPLGA